MAGIPLDAVRRVGAWVSYAVALGLVGLGIAITVRDGRPLLAGDVATSWAVSAGAGLLGAFVVTRRPRSRVGWLFLLTALLRGLTGATMPWTLRVYESGGSLPHAQVASWLQAATVAVVIPIAAVILVLFPDDRPAGRWARPVLALAGVSLVLLAVVVPAFMWRYRGAALLPDAPVPDTADAHLGNDIWFAGVALAVAAILIALASMVDRARRSHGDLRQQILWFAYGAGVALVVNLVADAAGLIAFRPLGAVAMLTGIGLGIFRYRLYDLDRLINRTLVYGLVTIAAVVAFGALDIVVATVVGGRSTVVAAVSAFVVALALRPLRDLSQDLIDRTFDRRTHSGVALVRSLGRRVGHENVDPAAVVETLRRALRDPGLTVLFHLRAADLLVAPDGTPVPRRRTAPPCRCAASRSRCCGTRRPTPTCSRRSPGRPRRCWNTHGCRPSCSSTSPRYGLPARG